MHIGEAFLSLILLQRLPQASSSFVCTSIPMYSLSINKDKTACQGAYSLTSK